jgi:hypothetical protein
LSITDKLAQLPILVIPNKDMLLPKRTKLRTEQLLPKLAVVKADI